MLCFKRMEETKNIFENKTICLRIAFVLLTYGAEINEQHQGKTLLYKLCAQKLVLEHRMVQVNFEVISFLL